VDPGIRRVVVVAGAVRRGGEPHAILENEIVGLVA
jgi:hypothetical protein